MSNQTDIENEVYGQEDDASVVQVTEAQMADMKSAVKLKDAVIKLSANGNFKLFKKKFIDEGLVNLGLNLGVQPQMRQEILMQIEARRIFNEFLSQAIEQGNVAEEVLGGLDD